MSSMHPVYETPNASSTSSDHTPDFLGLIWSPGACGRSQTTGLEFDLTRMSDVEFSNPQNFIQAQLEPGLSVSPNASPLPAAVPVQNAECSTGLSPNTFSEAIDLSTSTLNNDHSLMISGEKTPLHYGEVPSFVLARIRSEESPLKSTVKEEVFSKNRSISARVCLEKRFNSMCADTTVQQESHPAVLSNLLTVFQQTSETQEAFAHPQTQKWVQAERANPFKVSSSHIGGVFDPITNVFSQVVVEMAEPSNPQGLMMSPSLSFNHHPVTSVTKPLYTDSCSPKEEKEWVIAEKDVAPLEVSRWHCNSVYAEPNKATKTASAPGRVSRRDGRRRAHSSISETQRKERHNRSERERRKRIRLCCDELNTMVPFCLPETDKVTTLQWTAAFLRYINKTYGDNFKKEFQNVIINEKEMLLKFSNSSGQQPSSPKASETWRISLADEQ
ncbi:uncharacterized protein LOC119774085 [Cyprinodon tularosa]|uniref:uncharacterized protein LOC119774085 n=1 Tax=Cyprinodon tularosa TaxID=77115 RepID=UPI0018E2618E|nr:uncharacterized protein LOC119774085 [Cyprinodon tularosa]